MKGLRQETTVRTRLGRLAMGSGVKKPRTLHEKGSRRKVVVTTALFSVLLLAAAAWYGIWLLLPPQSGSLVSIDIRQGEPVAAMAEDLARVGLVKNPRVFEVYLSLSKRGRLIQAGHYQIRQGASIRTIAAILDGGFVVNSAVRITFPEGFTVRQMAQKLADSGVCTEKAFLNVVQYGSFDEPVMQSIHPSKMVKYRLEGFLFPDTYEFSKHEPAEQVVGEMLADFERHVDTASFQSALNTRGLTLYQLVTEASLVEREAKVSSERPIIASVIKNRLDIGMKLQIDATLEYILGHRNIITDADTKVNDPYNTYLHKGLPPGPIANPGMASMKAVLHPADTNYLYYVVKNNGTGEDYFASTYDEQLKNIARSQANLRKYGQ